MDTEVNKRSMQQIGKYSMKVVINASPRVLAAQCHEFILGGLEVIQLNYNDSFWRRTIAFAKSYGFYPIDRLINYGKDIDTVFMKEI